VRRLLGAVGQGAGLQQFPFVDVAFGPGQVHKLDEFLTSDSLSAQGFFEFEGFTGHLPMKRARDFQAWMQISVGCICRCSYCIVPSTRGREVSWPLGELVSEGAPAGRRRRARGDAAGPERQRLRARPAAGARDLPAVAGRARRDRRPGPHPLHQAAPKDMREDVVLAHAELASVMPQIHLPLQAGNSRILKTMRRTYTHERYMDRVALIREHVPDVAHEE
jgi:tRNA-2-methylthio-N6-dimethylallyladenosine synthase